MLKMTDAFAELEKCYAGVRGPDSFRGSTICKYVLNIDASSFSKKMNGHRNFVPRELSELARYFDLGENGMELFRLDSAEQFRNELRRRRIGIYATSPATLLQSTLWKMAEQSDATLNFHRLEKHPATRGGFEVLPSVESTHATCLGVGAKTKFKFEHVIDPAASYWFLLVNFHLETETINILTPTHEDDKHPINMDQTVFPSTSKVQIHRDTLLGQHRLYGVALDAPQLSVVTGELTRLRHLHHGQRLPGEITVNTGQLTLDREAGRRIREALSQRCFACGCLDYIQI